MATKRTPVGAKVRATRILHGTADTRATLAQRGDERPVPAGAEGTVAWFTGRGERRAVCLAFVTDRGVAYILTPDRPGVWAFEVVS